MVWSRLVAAAAVGVVLAGCGPAKENAAPLEGWRAEVKQIRMVVRGADDDPEMARRWPAYESYLEKITGLPVEFFEATDYNGTIQAISSGQVDIATMGAGSYANVDAQVGDLVHPIFVVRQAEGNMGYYSVLLVRTDSPYKTIDDLKGKPIGYVDFNSTSGFLYPRQVMRNQGYDPEAFFGKTVMAGGHTQAVMALNNGQFEAAMVSASGGTPETGFTTGPHFTMARRGLVDIKDFRVVWSAGPMPNSPVVMRTDRPQEMIDLIRGGLAVLPFEEPAIWREIGQATGGTFAPVDKAFYKDIIAIRTNDIAERRGLGSSQ